MKRNLPDWPAYGKEVEVKEPEAGEHSKAYAARERAGRVEANGVIRSLRVWYTETQASYREAR